MTKLILGMNTVGNKYPHWIESFTTVSYDDAKDSLDAGDEWDIMCSKLLDRTKTEPYSQVEKNIKDYVLLDEQNNPLELKAKNKSILIVRDGVEMTDCQGNVRLNERYNPEKTH